jgi:hypothetical protein
MVLTTGSADNSVYAMDMINNLRDLKGASLMYYSENNSWPPSGSSVKPNVFAKYRNSKYEGTQYQFNQEFYDREIHITTVETKGAMHTFIGMKLTDSDMRNKRGVIKKLTKSASGSGIYQIVE